MELCCGAARRAGISASYITKIERMRTASQPDTLERLIRSYDLDPMQARHTRELCEPPIDLTPVAELRDRVTTHERLAHLDYLDHNGVLAVYADPLRNVFAADTSFQYVFPGLDTAHSNWVARYFQPLAEQVAVQWDHEADYIIATLASRTRPTPRITPSRESVRPSAL
ncbi:helix-turn-helix transcriptional regulator [Nocardia sp. NPDC049190]|uniref:helix-turn-helix domain-containing protein n=1 Tax=Nocardia sp. NPDC049190 TaxID=3155650 RepID=UPI0033FD9A98